jgi:hypothetical protein
MRDKEPKLVEIKASHTLGGSGEGGAKGEGSGEARGFTFWEPSMGFAAIQPNLS